MKLLTVNVHAWLEERQDEKLDVLAQTIAEKAYDVIALQEVNQLITADLVTKDLKADNYGLILLEKLRALGQFDYSYYWSNSHIGYDKYEEGIAFLTKLPVYEVDPFYCSQNKSFDSILSRKIMGLTVFYQDQLIDLYSCHINLPDSKEENQLDNIRSIVERTSSGHLKILMGDFNTDALSNPQAYRAIKDLGLYDSYDLAEEKDRGITVEKAIDGWAGHSQEKRLDYVFLNQKRQVQSSRVIFNGENRPIISDHFGVEVNIGI
ncbi:endonuclease/exonuclease/phosphatase family protein [Streptococcus suis]|uniref:Metal-dependent hydrolase n=1 Tax=Streptococcus suis TaxID=1307 RepID=A0A0Z8ECE0_STRSU|nr:endonuclease/exonuclease/phosphatase family protein [Streptococcus suis]NQH94465.1 endonuclease/exonuclease/phosphatase family protein [Streptococcus suis]CYU59302.1 metal-dependent hydrolase [Streptococcus suis]HEL1644979.1 endonuclease/exonuclease/phosphatase family protein [Streptococcus suis]HEL2202270.1 endonuclease/exonuclease/phosphatase family protein [Streptococcus suis]HEM4265489.1 endonuclease/exonuclease/phosphatase family protein [Streptococcus suis]